VPKIAVVAISAATSKELAASCSLEISGIGQIAMNHPAAIPSPIKVFQAGLRILLSEKFEVHCTNQVIGQIVNHHHVI
jgi:hypothetical protein